MTIAQVTLSTTDTTIIAAPPSGQYANVGIMLCNYSSNDVTVELYVTSTGTGADSNSILRSLVIQAKDTFMLNAEKLLLGTTWSVVGKASAGSSVVATASYISI